MQVVFASNYINHHQIPFSEAMVKRLGEGNYTFVQTEPMTEERRNMGWGKEGLPAYVRCAYESEEEREACRKLILESDAVIFGGTDEESWIEPRLQAGRFTMRYSERVYKTGQWKFITPRGLIRKYHDHTSHRKDPVYLLCAGGYVASDYGIFHSYPGKMYRWGYFPEFVPEDVDKLMSGKSGDGPVRLLWAGRFIDWKHPERALMGAKHLKDRGIPFHLNVIGGGPLADSLEKLAYELGLDTDVTFLGFRSPSEVREEMRRSDVLLFTSDRQEGWGAVANEAMNSGCVVLADAMIGAVPYLIRTGYNGAVYTPEKEWGFCTEKTNLFYEWLEKLATDRETREYLARNAYRTIAERWNADYAAEELIRLIERLKNGETVCCQEAETGTESLLPAPCTPERPKRESRIRAEVLRGTY